MMARRNDITDCQIFDLYFKQGLNRRQTAEKLACSGDLVAYRIKKMGLRPKSMSDCVESGRKRSAPMSQELVNIMNGELLGDGGLIVYKRQGSFRESVGFDKKEWAAYLIDIIKDNNIPIIGDKLYLRKPCGKSRKHTWSFGTLNTIELGDLHNIWYTPNKSFSPGKPAGFDNRKFIKVVPSCLILTPISLLHWYVGDGSPSNTGNCIIHTQGFTWEQVEFLRFRLKQDLNVLTAHYQNNTISIPRREYEKMLEIIGPCPVECYEYKWKIPHTKCRKNRKVNFSIDMRAIESYVGGI